jgi:hypothetical protein
VSELDALRARERLRALDPTPSRQLAALAERWAAVRRSLVAPLVHKSLLVCASDHGVGDPGDLGGSVATVRAIASGTAAVAVAAQSAGARLILVDCGLAEGSALGKGVLSFRIGDATGDLRRGPAAALDAAHAAVRPGGAVL